MLAPREIGGAVAAARARRVGWHDALAIGALMNTRGLIELVALTIGFEHGVLDRRLFPIMVLMAIATTLLTGPLLSLIQRLPAPPRPTRSGARRAPCDAAPQPALERARDTARP